ncbi:MAG: ComEA family DNA-binding protein [Bacillota bacterium]
MNLGRREQLLILLLAVAVAFGLGAKYTLYRQIPVSQPAVEKSDTPPQIRVHVSGAVYRPGVYLLPQGSRVIDAVEKAGASTDADLDAMNLAQFLEDGRKVPVPQKIKTEGQLLPDSSNPFVAPVPRAGPATVNGGTGTGVVARVNINTADSAALDTLPGVGPATAQKIIEYRTANGQFASVDDLINVTGIGEKKLEQLRDYVFIQ